MPPALPATPGAPGSREYRIPTAGSCMWPWIWPDGEIRVERCRVADLAPGDIAVWFDGRRLLSHRVISVRGERLVTKGDGNPGTDLPVAPEQLLGRVTYFRFLGVGWRLDGPLGRAVGRAVVAVPWLVPVARRLHAPLRRALGRAAERVYTAGPVRRLRRRLPRRPVVVSVDASPPGTALSWPLWVRVRRGGLEVGHAAVAADGAVSDLWVRNLWRGEGVGRALLAAAVTAARSRGLPGLRVPGAGADGRARTLLRSAGFREDAAGALVLALPALPGEVPDRAGA